MYRVTLAIHLQYGTCKACSVRASELGGFYLTSGGDAVSSRKISLRAIFWSLGAADLGIE